MKLGYSVYGTSLGVLAIKEDRSQIMRNILRQVREFLINSKLMGNHETASYRGLTGSGHGGTLVELDKAGRSSLLDALK